MSDKEPVKWEQFLVIIGVLIGALYFIGNNVIANEQGLYNEMMKLKSVFLIISSR